MTQQEALEEARRRWGPEAVAIHYDLRSDDHHSFEVNSDPYSPKPLAYGTGASWEAAFADADRRANEG